MVANSLSLAAAPLTLYVSPQGNDAWSGRLAVPAADGKDGPRATVAAALEGARAARKGQPAPGPISILLRDGVYRLTAPIVLSVEDSGASAAEPFVIGAYPGEHPVLSGGERVEGWRPVENKPGLWAARLAAGNDPQAEVRSLFINGRRATRARTPNEGEFFRMVGARLQDKPCVFQYKAGDLRPQWASSPGAQVVALEKWTDWRFYIRSIVPESNLVVLAGASTPHTREKDARYFVENTADSLDAPGEWYWDRARAELRYWARPGEDLTRAEAVVPRVNPAPLACLVRLQGDWAARQAVRHITLRGLSFQHTEWPTGPNGHRDSQAAPTVRGAVAVEAAVGIALEDCVFAHLGGYAVDLGKGAQQCRVTGAEMYDLGAGGVRVGETVKPAGSFEECHSHVIADNHIHDAGQVFFPAVGVFIMHSGTNRVSHNHIHHLYYSAISAGWQWGYQETPCRANIIEFNHLHDLGQGLLSDMGAVYTLGIQQGTVIRNNLIHDVDSFTYGGWGLYTDEGSTGIVLENNVVYRCKSAGFHQHYGRDNIVRNNIFAFNRENQLMRTRAEPHRSFWFTNNIVLFDSGKLLGSNWSNDNYEMDGNLYFDARPGAIPSFAGATLAQWRARGHDTRSLIADPRFVAPERDDFHLRPDSPAFALGFQPIEVNAVGVRKK